MRLLVSLWYDYYFNRIMVVSVSSWSNLKKRVHPVFGWNIKRFSWLWFSITHPHDQIVFKQKILDVKTFKPIILLMQAHKESTTLRSIYAEKERVERERIRKDCELQWEMPAAPIGLYEGTVYRFQNWYYSENENRLKLLKVWERFWNRITNLLN